MMRLHVARAVDEIEHRSLLAASAARRSSTSLRAIHLEDDVERRNLLLDQAPLVDAARALEQQRLRVDRHEVVVLVGRDVRPRS